VSSLGILDTLLLEEKLEVETALCTFDEKVPQLSNKEWDLPILRVQLFVHVQRLHLYNAAAAATVESTGGPC